MNATPLWSPSEEQIRRSRMMAFMDHLRHRGLGDFHDYESLHAWSIDDRAGFWSAFWDFADVLAADKGEEILRHPDAMPGSRWFPQARLNFAENLLRYRDERIAILFRGEDGERQSLTYAQVYEQTAALAVRFHTLGIGVGDRVAAVLPNRPETLIAMLATAWLGAVWSSCSPDFGDTGIIDRFGQIEPKLLITVDSYRFKGKEHDLYAKMQRVLDQLPTVEHAIQLTRTGKPSLSGAEDWSQAIAWTEPPPAFVQAPFDHPLYILFSSGTTGKPKCIVHGAGGTLLQHLKELMLHTDLRREDRLFFFTTCGWMMWNWLASGLAVGATLMLYDGHPFHPGPAALMDLAEEEDISVFGTSANYLSALEKAGVIPRQHHRLPRLRAILSTGSPLAPESFDYVYRDIKPDLQLASISGGTDIVSCFVLGCPIRPVYRGQLQCAGLGMAVEVFDEHGRPATPSTEAPKGELVCARSFPSMPVGFWNDPDGSRYRAAYFERFEGVWTHGDWAERTPQGGFVIHGRSDAVLNPGGVRIGTAEIYRQVEKIDSVLESIAVGQDWQDDVRVVLFVVLREGVRLDDALRQTIRHRLKTRASPRHVPAKIIQVADIPKTRSGKIVELAVRDAVHGKPVHNTEALVNPEALDLYRNLQELIH